MPGVTLAPPGSEENLRSQATLALPLFGREYAWTVQTYFKKLTIMISAQTQEQVSGMTERVIFS